MLTNLRPNTVGVRDDLYQVRLVVFSVGKETTSFHKIFIRSSPRSISIGQLNTLPCLHLQPIYLIIFKGSYFRRMGNLILRAASRLDAFSVYPFHT